MPLGESRLDSAAEIGLIKDWAPDADSGFADRVCLFTNTDAPVEHLCLSIRGSLTAHRLVFHPFSERSPIQEELLREPSNAKQILAQGFHRVVVLDVSRAVDRKGAFDLADFYQYAFAELVRAFGIAPSEAYHEEDMVQILRDEPTSLLCFLNAHLAPSQDRSRLRSLTQEKHHSLIIYRCTVDIPNGLRDAHLTDKDKKPDSQSGPTTFSDEDVVKARLCFARGHKLVAMRKYDQAIEMYISGLEYWPDAVEEGHNPCRAAALFRGPKNVGVPDSMKYKTTGKHFKACMLNAERLLSKDPRNINYMEAFFKSAAAGRFNKTAMWIGEILADAVHRQHKPNPARFITLREIYEMLGDLNVETDSKLAIAALERAVDALCRLRGLKPNDGEIATSLRDVAGKLTIVKRRYLEKDFEESYKEPIDKDLAVRSDGRLDTLIAQAQEQYEAEPTNSTRINELADLLCRREQEAEETKAMKILVRAHEQSNEYRYRMRAHDIYMKQLRRKTRQLREARDPQIDQARAKQLSVELAVYKERVEQYPTDLGFRFEYGKRLFEAQRYDEAIPILEEARNEPRIRSNCGLYIGRCFFEKGCHRQAANIFRDAIGAYEIPDDQLGKELHYWLGRAFQSDGNTAGALKTYGQLIEWDYNYRTGDVRKRIEQLHQMGSGGRGA